MSDIFYNNEEKLVIKYSGLLPHWHQDGKMQFVTFRLIDSLPQSKIHELSELKQSFIVANPLPWDNETASKYWNLISPFESKLLDAGYGSCILRNPDVRKIVSNAMRFWDGSKYYLWAYVIMPNHVHVLFHLIGDNTTESVMHSIKSYSSTMINKLLKRSGKLWMKECFDRMIRSEQHLNSCINYIISNPRFLKEGDYEIYLNEDYIMGGKDAANP